MLKKFELATQFLGLKLLYLHPKGRFCQKIEEQVVEKELNAETNNLEGEEGEENEENEEDENVEDLTLDEETVKEMQTQYIPFVLQIFKEGVFSYVALDPDGDDNPLYPTFLTSPENAFDDDFEEINFVVNKYKNHMPLEQYKKVLGEISNLISSSVIEGVLNQTSFKYIVLNINQPSLAPLVLLNPSYISKNSYLITQSLIGEIFKRARQDEEYYPALSFTNYLVKISLINEFFDQNPDVILFLNERQHIEKYEYFKILHKMYGLTQGTIYSSLSNATICQGLSHLYWGLPKDVRSRKTLELALKKLIYVDLKLPENPILTHFLMDLFFFSTSYAEGMKKIALSLTLLNRIHLNAYFYDVLAMLSKTFKISSQFDLYFGQLLPTVLCNVYKKNTQIYISYMQKFKKFVPIKGELNFQIMSTEAAKSLGVLSKNDFGIFDKNLYTPQCEVVYNVKERFIWQEIILLHGKENKAILKEEKIPSLASYSRYKKIVEDLEKNPNHLSSLSTKDKSIILNAFNDEFRESTLDKRYFELNSNSTQNHIRAIKELNFDLISSIDPMEDEEEESADDNDEHFIEDSKIINSEKLANEITRGFSTFLSRRRYFSDAPGTQKSDLVDEGLKEYFRKLKEMEENMEKKSTQDMSVIENQQEPSEFENQLNSKAKPNNSKNSEMASSKNDSFIQLKPDWFSFLKPEISEIEILNEFSKKLYSLNNDQNTVHNIFSYLLNSTEIFHENWKNPKTLALAAILMCPEVKEYQLSEKPNLEIKSLKETEEEKTKSYCKYLKYSCVQVLLKQQHYCKLLKLTSNSKIIQNSIKKIVAHMIYFSSEETQQSKILSDEMNSEIIKKSQEGKLSKTLVDIIKLLLANEWNIENHQMGLLINTVYLFPNSRDEIYPLYKYYLRVSKNVVKVNILQEYIKHLIREKKQTQYLYILENLTDFIQAKKSKISENAKSNEIAQAQAEFRIKLNNEIHAFNQECVRLLIQAGDQKTASIIFRQQHAANLLRNKLDYLNGFTIYQDNIEDFEKLYQQFKSQKDIQMDEELFVTILEAIIKEPTALQSYIEILFNEFLFEEVLTVTSKLIKTILYCLIKIKDTNLFLLFLTYMLFKKIPLNGFNKTLAYRFYNHIAAEMSLPTLKGMLIILTSQSFIDESKEAMKDPNYKNIKFKPREQASYMEINEQEDGFFLNAYKKQIINQDKGAQKKNHRLSKQSKLETSSVEKFSIEKLFELAKLQNASTQNGIPIHQHKSFFF